MKNENIGSSFDDWLHDEGIYERATSMAIKRVLARQLAEAIESQSITKAEMARRMKTSRSAIDRLLDPSNASVTLATLEKAAVALGRRLHVELV